jgi:hypothetical protein
MTKKKQLCRIIYYSLAALYVSSDIFAHHKEHLNCITASGITYVCRCQLGENYGCSKGYPQRNAAHMGSISLWISFASIFFAHKIRTTPLCSIVVYVFRGAAIL